MLVKHIRWSHEYLGLDHDQVVLHRITEMEDILGIWRQLLPADQDLLIRSISFILGSFIEELCLVVRFVAILQKDEDDLLWVEWCSGSPDDLGD